MCYHIFWGRLFSTHHEFAEVIYLDITWVIYFGIMYFQICSAEFLMHWWIDKCLSDQFVELDTVYFDGVSFHFFLIEYLLRSCILMLYHRFVWCYIINLSRSFILILYSLFILGFFFLIYHTSAVSQANVYLISYTCMYSINACTRTCTCTRICNAFLYVYIRVQAHAHVHMMYVHLYMSTYMHIYTRACKGV